MPERICSIEGCAQASHARGWCAMHYGRWRHNGDPLVSFRKQRQPCSIAGCDKPAQARTWCKTHWARWKRTGDPEFVRPKAMCCGVVGCDAPPRSAHAEYCETHYYRLRRTGSVHRLWIAGVCRECDEPYVALSSEDNGFCSAVHAHRNCVRLRHSRIKSVTVGDPVDLPTLAERDGWRCHVCKRRVTRKTWTVDHLVPLSFGGEHSYANVALAHRSCNSRRNNRGTAQLLLIG